MGITLNLPNKLVEELVKRHLEDGESVQRKVVVLLEYGLILQKEIERNRIVLSVSKMPGSATKNYMESLEIISNPTSEN